MLFLPYLLSSSVFLLLGVLPSLSPNIRYAYRLELSSAAEKVKTLLDESRFASQHVDDWLEKAILKSGHRLTLDPPKDDAVNIDHMYHSADPYHSAETPELDTTRRDSSFVIEQDISAHLRADRDDGIESFTAPHHATCTRMHVDMLTPARFFGHWKERSCFKCEAIVVGIAALIVVSVAFELCREHYCKRCSSMTSSNENHLQFVDRGVKESRSKKQISIAETSDETMVDGNSNEPVVRHSNVQSRTSASSSTLNRRVSLPSVYSIIDTKPNEELLRNQFWYERGYLAARRQNGGDSFGRTPHAPPLFDGATETFELTPTPTGTEEESPSDGMQYRQMSSWVDRSPSPIRHQQQEKLYKNNDRAADIREDSSGDLHNNVQRLKPAHEIHSRNENHRYIDDEEHDKDQGHARTASGQPRVSEGTRTVLREILEPTVNQPPTFPHHKLTFMSNTP